MIHSQKTLTLTAAQVAIVKANHGPDRKEWKVIAKEFGISIYKLNNNLKMIDRPKRQTGPYGGKVNDGNPAHFNWNKFAQVDFIMGRV